ncbi:hypothetical protein L3Q82_002676 [Scortum barcoo]|uniref:Uncharacterized protein n=1 Tax=Scortum barcoo TaxID=214431 RepID=A0ACB8VVB9_9TELE|nr:hypothetical protein L3Q82_002676 [Scortum barcoo]
MFLSKLQMFNSASFLPFLLKKGGEKAPHSLPVVSPRSPNLPLSPPPPPLPLLLRLLLLLLLLVSPDRISAAELNPLCALTDGGCVKTRAEARRKWGGPAFKVTGQTKSGSKPIMKRRISRTVTSVARIGVTRAPPWSQAWGWGSQASAWWPGLCPRDPARPGSARNGDVGPPSSRLTTRRKVHEGPVQCGLGSSRGRGPRTTQSLDQNSGNRDMECHLAGGKEPELVAGRLRGTG